MQALANQQIQASDKLTAHLAHCLGCRNCERVCPSGVDYGYMLDHSRLLLNQLRPMTGLKKHLNQAGLKLTQSKNMQRTLQTALYYYQKSGMQALLRLSGILRLLHLRHVERLIPTIHRYYAFKPSYSATTPSKGKLGLFVGCTGHLFDQPTLQQTIHLLQKLGYEVVLPEQQTCCGALHQHQGQTEFTQALAMQNIRAFTELDTIVYIASGCGAQLHEYSSLAWPDKEAAGQAESFAKRVKEITAFLSEEDLTSFQFKPLTKRLAIHTPCSMRNGLRQTDASLALLKHIPLLQIESIPAETGCCGAAGSYMISQAKLSRIIRQTTLDAIDDLQVDIVSTTNIGCGLHLKAGWSGKTLYTHPVSLLVNQITFK